MNRRDCLCFAFVLWGVLVAGIIHAAEPTRGSQISETETRFYWAISDVFELSVPFITRKDTSVSLSPDEDFTPSQEPSFLPWADFAPTDSIAPLDLWPETENPTVFMPGFEDSVGDLKLVRGGIPQLFGARGRIRGEYGDEFDDVERIRGQLLWTLARQVGIDVSVNSWEDERPGPQALGDFWTGDANLVYSMGSQRVAMRGGVGASWVYDSDIEVGYNVTYAADVFLTRPWLLTGEIDYGEINQEKLFHWRATAGVQLLRFEIYVGYDSYEWSNLRFDGPVAGAGMWF